MIIKLLKHIYTILNKKRFPAFGKNSYVSPYGIYMHRRKIYIGENVYIGPRAILSANQGLIIGNGVIIGPEFIVMGGDHNYSVVGKRMYQVKEGGKNEKVIIEDDVWIGARVTILKGVSIGEGSVIGAGSVVTRNILPYAVYAGNPARFIKERFSQDKLRQHLKLVSSKYSFEDVASKLFKS